MSDNVLECVRATVQDFLATELKTHGVKLENLERRLDHTLIRNLTQQAPFESGLRERMASLEARLPKQ